MQRLLALEQIDLFADLSFEQVDAIRQASEDAEYLPGETIIREGEPGTPSISCSKAALTSSSATAPARNAA
jgi:hypothetical protein